jgi:hypothetical protein
MKKASKRPLRLGKKTVIHLDKAQKTWLEGGLTLACTAPNCTVVVCPTTTTATQQSVVKVCPTG